MYIFVIFSLHISLVMINQLMKMYGVRCFGQTMSGMMLHTNKQIYICSDLHLVWYESFGRTMSGPGLADKDSLPRRLEIIPWPGL